MTFLFCPAHKSSDVLVSDCFVNFLSELDYFDSANHLLLVLINSQKMLCWSSLLTCSLCLLNCFLNFWDSSAAWVLLDKFDQWHCQIHKLLYKVHEIISVCLNVWKYIERFKHVQILHVSCNSVSLTILIRSSVMQCLVRHLMSSHQKWCRLKLSRIRCLSDLSSSCISV